MSRCLVLLMLFQVCSAEAQRTNRRQLLANNPPAAGGGGGGGTVAFDARTTNLQNTTSSSTTFSHTVTGSSPALVVFVVLTGTAQTVSGVTYNGVAMSSLGSKNSTLGNPTQCRVEAWGLAAPATGAHNVAVTLSAANSSWDVIANSFTGTAAAGTFDGFQSAEGSSASSVSVTVTTGDTGDMVVDCSGSTADNGTTSGAGQTQRWQDNSGSSNTQGGTKAGGASVTMTENWDSNDNGKILVGVNINHN